MSAGGNISHLTTPKTKYSFYTEGVFLYPVQGGRKGVTVGLRMGLRVFDKHNQRVGERLSCSYKKNDRARGREGKKKKKNNQSPGRALGARSPGGGQQERRVTKRTDIAFTDKKGKAD